jgi:hypothetical protein
MGGSRYSDDDYSSRDTYRKTHGIPTFKYDHDIKTGKIAASVHATLDPFGVKIRESRDSADQWKVPIAVFLDTTGSMAQVPEIIQKSLPKLMGGFLNDKASGKKYLGEKGYPDIMIGAVDDYDAMGSYNAHKGCLQVGQFESGMEIDDNLTNLWLTGHGGGTYEESYQLGMYFLARHTEHDHWDKRKRKGYMFIIGDEHPYPLVKAKEVKTIIGDALQGDIALADILKELKTRYHVFFVLPNMTNHYSDPRLVKDWVKLLGQQNVLKLEDPSKICALIVAAVAICETNIGLDDLSADSVVSVSMSRELGPLASGALTHGEGLAEIPGTASKIARF